MVEKEKIKERCKAYCKHGRRCPKGATLYGYCIPHYSKSKDNPKKWERLQRKLNLQAQQ